jgi:hypothetical protein
MVKVLKSVPFNSGKNQNTNEPAVCLLDGDPTTGGGVPEEAGTIGIFPNAGNPKFYKKTGAADTDWVRTFGNGLDLANTIFADSNAEAGGNGSSAFPFNSLQAAINYVEANFNKFERKIILVGANSAFDEDIVVTGGIMTIMGLGAFTIGDAAGSAFSSTVPRNFTYVIDDDTTDGKWGSIVLGTILDDETSSTHTAYLNGCTISGDFLVTNSGAFATSKNIQLRNVKVVGNYDTTGAGAAGLQTYLRRCFFDNLFNSPVGLLNIIDSCQFDGLITSNSYNRIKDCEIRSGMTTGACSSSLPPCGFLNTDFSGVFTSASPMLLDAITNYHFNANGASLAGGATKLLLHDLT